MAEPLYGCKMLEVQALDEYGEVTGAAELFETPQEATVAFNVDEGAEQELYGGDRLVAKIIEEDYLTSATITFTDADLTPDAVEIITGGGTATETGFTAPTLSEQESGRTAFRARLYVARYNEGVSDQGEIIGYTRFTFAYCKGTLSGVNPSHGEFVVPEFSIEATENTVATPTVPLYDFEHIDTGDLPSS